jgi:SAM-dependent methyltransferase
MNLEAIAVNIKKRGEIYFSGTNSEIFYPADGNEICYKVEEESFWFKHRNNCIKEAVKKFCPDKVFFDIGGGNGFTAKSLQDSGIETVNVEPGEQGAINSINRGLKNVICSTLDDAGFKPSSLPVIGLFDVVEHIDDDKAFLQNIYHYLENNGLVFITVPAYKFLWSDEDNFVCHFRRYLIKDLTTRLRDIGYKIEYSTYIFSILPLPIFLFRTIPWILGLKKFITARKKIDIELWKKEHKTRLGFTGNLLEKIWRWELKRIKNKRFIPFGGSCFIIARKP